MERFTTNIKEKFCDKLINKFEKQWPPCHSNNLKLELSVREKRDLEQYSGKHQRDHNGRDYKATPLAYSDFFKVKSRKEPIRTVLVEGCAGIGKTTLCISVSKDWANGKLFQEYKLLLLLPLNLKTVASAGSLSVLIETLMLQDVNFHVVSYLKERNGEGILIIADGWDKLDESQRQEGSFLYNLLFGDILGLASVIVTSRPTASAPLHRGTCIDRFVEVHGFNKESIKEYIRSEFTRDHQSADYLLEQVKGNPMMESMCSVPLSCTIVCHLWRTLDEVLPTTMTELCTKIILNIVLHNMQTKDNVCIPGLTSIDDLPEGLQDSWWHLCQLAFQTIQNNWIVPSQLDFCLSDMEIFGLLEYVVKGNGVSFHFHHPTFQEYLAALYLVKQPPDTQLEVLHTKAKQFTVFWKYFFGICDQGNVLKHAVQIISTSDHSKSLLCHCAFEARNEVVSSEVIKALSTKTHSKVFIHFGDPHTAHDCAAIVYVIDNMQGSECDRMEINFKACSLGAKLLCKLADILARRPKKLQVKDLDLSDNNLSDESVADLFHRASTAFQSLEKLFLRNNKVGRKGISAIMAALAESSSHSVMQLDLSYNPLTLTGLQVLQDAVKSGTLANLEIFFMQGSLTTDANINIQYLSSFAEVLLSHCLHLRRLDLSGNDLGEPGTNVVSRIILKLVGSDKNFDLCLNREYMSEVDKSFIAIMEDSVRRKGTIDHTIVHGVIVGPGRSGKNSLMNRLMGEGPLDPDTISSSTGVLETIVKVEVKKLCTVAAAVNNVMWKKLDYDEEALELMMTTVKSHSASIRVNEPIPDINDSRDMVTSAVIMVESTDTSTASVPTLSLIHI